MIFLDASVVLAYYLMDAYSARAQAVYEENPSPMLSDLVELEVLSALSRLVRTRSIELAAARGVAEMFTAHLEGGFYARLQLERRHYRLAREYIARFDLPVKSPDALHLAVSAAEGVRFVTADRQLARSGEALGVAVELLEA